MPKGQAKQLGRKCNFKVLGFLFWNFPKVSHYYYKVIIVILIIEMSTKSCFAK